MAFVLTEQDILNATAYMPIAKKVTTAQAIAKISISKVDVTSSDDEGTGNLAQLPPRYVENVQFRSMYQMMILFSYYLNKDINGELTVEKYDELGESAIFNQLDRMKQSKNLEVRNKVYDILDDYRELTKFIGSEIASRLSVQNDPIERIGAWLKKEIPPEFIAKLREGLTGARDEFAAYNESRKQKGLAN